MLLSADVKNEPFLVVQVTAHCEKGGDGCWKEVCHPQTGLWACCANAHVSLPGWGKCQEIRRRNQLEEGQRRGDLESGKSLVVGHESMSLRSFHREAYRFP